MAKSKDEERRRFANENQARVFFENMLSECFEFYPEVHLRSVDGQPLRIDSVARCKTRGWHFGIEFKRSSLFCKEYSDALRQSIDYRMAVIDDSRLPILNGQKLPAVAVFPDWLGEHDVDDINYKKESDGMRLLAAHFRVGALRERSGGRISFYIGPNAVWHSISGWTKLAEGLLFGSQRIGSRSK